MSNADDKKHGEEFGRMMEGLKTLAVIRGNSRHIGAMASEALLSSSYDKAISEMKRYRRKLKLEVGGDREDRQRQIAFLKDMITRAKADKAAAQARLSTRLGNKEISGGAEGGINKVTRYERGEQGAFFKPQKEDSSDVEREVMERIGIQPAQSKGPGQAAHDPKLANREIAYSRLGALLGSSVTLDAKKAQSQSGQSGVLMEEAKGKSWTQYNWDYLSPGASPGTAAARAALIGSKTNTVAGANLGDRIGGLGLTRRSTTDDPNYFGRNLEAGAFAPGADTLDATDPDFQRQMNEMFLLDTLAAHTDRHSGNYHVGYDEAGKISVKAIDNDLTFGALGSREADKAAFGKRGSAHNYGGLPAQMQIDAKMARRIRMIDRETLDKTFRDLLDKKEIDALETRFDMMKEYITQMERAGYLVEQWNAATAEQEMRLAGGIGSYDRESKGASGGYAGNNYYQRQMLTLSSAEQRDMSLMYEAAGMYRDLKKK